MKKIKMFEEDDVNKKFKNLQVSSSSDINILLLGGTGVGKSTFINSLANYISYSDIKQPEKERKVEVLIPSSFTIKDKYGTYHDIKAGEEDKNEFLKTGESATQDVKTYVFPIYDNQIKVRIIDTPGLQDTRNIDQDAINCENILAYIGQLHELHAICFLFEPNASRNTVVFRYCIDQMLARLDKTASRNIVFIFTNTRGSDYRPGETINLLQNMVDKLKNNPPHIEIPLRKNVFCFDNECFPYLVAKKRGIRFDKETKEYYRKSWKQSSEAFWKLIRYIEGDQEHRPLKPHHVKNTNAVNEARRMIIQLAQPLAEIVQLININLEILQGHEDKLNIDNQTLEDMRNKMFMPVVNLDVIKLTQPATICTSRQCADIVKVAGKSSWHYKQRCHDPCYLTNVPKEIIGSPELKHCASMYSDFCVRCSHCYTVHMHVYYLTKLKEEQVVDPNIVGNIENKERLIESKRKLIASMNMKSRELEGEYRIIVNCSAEFAHFLENNAIAPFSDSYKEYIEYLIDREKSLGARCDTQSIYHLCKLLKEYESAKQVYDDALRRNKLLGNNDEAVTVKDIQNGIQTLYRLKHNGPKIKELYECQKKARQKEHQNNEYVHKMVKITSTSTRDENKNKSKKDEEKKSTTDKNKQSDKYGKNQQSRDRRDHSQVRTRANPPAYQDVYPQNRHQNYQMQSSVSGQNYPYYRQGDNFWPSASSPYPGVDSNRRFGDSGNQRSNGGNNKPVDITVSVQANENRPYPNEAASSNQPPYQGVYQREYNRGGPFQGNPYHGVPYQVDPYNVPPYQGGPYQNPYHVPPYQGGPYQNPYHGAPYQGHPPPPRHYPQDYLRYNQHADERANRGRDNNRGIKSGHGYRGGRGNGRVHKSRPDTRKNTKKNKETDSDDSSASSSD